MKGMSVSEMKALDRKAIEEIGIPSIVLMENAGRGVAEVAQDMLDGGMSGKNIAIFCGIGNNGGDGFVAARYLVNKEAEVRVYIVGDKSRIKGDAKINLGILERMIAEPMRNVTRNLCGKLEAISKADLIIDAIFGVGLKGEVKEPACSIIKELNSKNVPVLSVDIPSGLDADTGEVLGEVVRAKKTATMHLPKKGFYIAKGPECVGEVVVVDIGIPKEVT